MRERTKSQLKVIKDNTVTPEKRQFLLRQVENILYEHPGVEEVAVLYTMDRDEQEILTAFVVTRDSSLTEKDIYKFLQESGRLKPEELPGRYKLVPEIPKTPSGKVLKLKLVKDF